MAKKVQQQSFFDEKKPAAVFKHELLGSYLSIFIQKAGSQGGICYLDGYAGPGTYDDGEAGSPAVAIGVAESVAATRDVIGIFVENDPANFDLLSTYVADKQPAWPPPIHGKLEDHLDDVLTTVGDRRLFAFLDPFGTSIPFDALVNKVMSRDQGGFTTSRKATEVLINFSDSGIRRLAGHYKSPKNYKAKDALVKRLDDYLGGDWWKEIWDNVDDPTDRLELCTTGFRKRLAAATKDWAIYSVPVYNSLTANPAYRLVFATRHFDGLWLFHERVSVAAEKARESHVEQSGEFDFDPLPAREVRWVDEIARNIENLLARGDFVVQREMRAVYGDTLGQAREKHVRAAITGLHVNGTTSTSPKGEKIPGLVVKRPS